MASCPTGSSGAAAAPADQAWACACKCGGRQPLLLSVRWPGQLAHSGQPHRTKLRMAVLGLRYVGLPNSGSSPAATAACTSVGPGSSSGRVSAACGQGPPVIFQCSLCTSLQQHEHMAGPRRAWAPKASAGMSAINPPAAAVRCGRRCTSNFQTWYCASMVVVRSRIFTGQPFRDQASSAGSGRNAELLSTSAAAASAATAISEFRRSTPRRRPP